MEPIEIGDSGQVDRDMFEKEPESEAGIRVKGLRKEFKKVSN